jgi:hypothetical protein
MMLQLRWRRRWSVAEGAAAAASSCRRRCPNRAAASAAEAVAEEASARQRRPRRRSQGTGPPLSPDRRRCPGTAVIWHQIKQASVRAHRGTRNEENRLQIPTC